ncbi:ROK family protein [Amycolatopsis sp. PS_44_ISF1]|uniref:ROK family protein n=1 Tax=Amycolatopsis sp. PS_44_ISF1 TaxID=2974917 RepID=UPI0028DEEACA|nr:ROK family protein [Amycolatopsis sp. PS_44_ISF1]MDT8913706.1 ROK family protein [Amycolatopsis sp. PS_44_ISF1]
MDVFDQLRGGDQSALRGLNIQRVLRLSFDRPVLTTTSVAQYTGLSRPTAQTILSTLVEADLLRLDGHDARRGGRPAQQYRFAGDSRYVAGVDIGAYSISVRVASLDNVTVAAVRRAVSPDLGAEARIACVAAMIADAAPAGLVAVALGSPGIIDAHGVVRQCVAITGWAGVDLAAEFGRRLGCPITATKDTNLAVLAEHRLGAAQDVQIALYVHLGHRLGVAALIAGLPFTGWSGAAGEIGRHPGLGWEQAPGELFRMAGVPAGSAESANEWVFTRAAEGDAHALTAVDLFARTLADGIGAMVLALDPQRVVIGGGAARAGSVVLEPIQRHLAKTCYVLPEVVLSALNDDSVVLGAVEVAMAHARDLVLASAVELVNPV